MNHYKTILAAIDLNPEGDKITIQRAKQLAEDHKAELYVVHAIESINAYGATYAYPALSDIESQLLEEHQNELTAEAKALKIPKDRLIIKVGAASNVIVNQAKAISANLIVVGTDSRHGIGLLLGSTTDSVLHNAPCDVLAIKLDH